MYAAAHKQAHAHAPASARTSKRTHEQAHVQLEDFALLWPRAARVCVAFFLQLTLHDVWFRSHVNVLLTVCGMASLHFVAFCGMHLSFRYFGSSTVLDSPGSGATSPAESLSPPLSRSTSPGGGTLQRLQSWEEEGGKRCVSVLAFCVGVLCAVIASSWARAQLCLWACLLLCLAGCRTRGRTASIYTLWCL